MAEMDLATFHWADYLVFVLSLMISLGIGFFYAIKDRKKQNNEEFLMAGRSMSIGPVTASTFATLVSSIGFVADPVEVYYFGVSYIFIACGGMLGIIPIAEVFVPAFHKMNLVSAFQYLEETFSASLRKTASLLQIFLMLLYMGMMTYAPSVSLAQVSGINIWTGMVITTAVCTIYTTFGGMKAVVWSDTIQMFVMFAGVIVLAIKAITDLGGMGSALDIIREGQRTSYINWNPDPFVRSGFFAYFIGGFFRVMVPLSSTQIAIQRYCTLPTVREAKISVYLIIPMYMFLSTVFLFVGFAMYGHYAECDPLFSGRIAKIDQYVPYLVMKVLGEWPGMPGLFIACIFAASLSTLSSGQNALAAVILKDLIEPVYQKKKNKPMSEKMGFLVAKGLACVVGVVVMCMSFVIVALGGNLFILLNKIFGTFAGPLGGLFTVAILMKSVRDQTAVIFGFLASTAVTLWFAIGSLIYSFTPNALPISVANCTVPEPLTTPSVFNFTGSTTPMPTPTPGSILDHLSTLPPTSSPDPFKNPTGFARMYSLSPMYYALVGYGLCVLFTFIADRVRKCWFKRQQKKRGKYDVDKETKYSKVEGKEMGSWEKEKATRLSQMPTYIITRKDEQTQTLESVPPGAKRDILWVYDKESNL